MTLVTLETVEHNLGHPSGSTFPILTITPPLRWLELPLISMTS